MRLDDELRKGRHSSAGLAYAHLDRDWDLHLWYERDLLAPDVDVSAEAKPVSFEKHARGETGQDVHGDGDVAVDDSLGDPPRDI